MKKLIFTLTIFATVVVAAAQPAAITVFSDSEPLILKVDGTQINEKPQTSVTAWDITAQNIRLFVTLPQKGINLKQNIMVRPGKEMKVIAKQKRNGKWKLRYMGQGPMPEKPKAQKKESAQKQPAKPQNEQVSTQTTVNGTSQNVSISATTTVTEDSSSESESETVNVNTQVGGADVSMTVTETSTTTTTTTSTSGTSTPPADPEEDCMPMSSMDFNDAKNSISNKSFEDSKVTQAKQIIKNNCLRANQIKAIMQLMTYEDSKLTIAKFAHSYCYNKGNYYKVNDAFTYESSIEDLNEYLEGQ